MNRLVKRSYTKDVILVVLYIFLIFYTFIFWSTTYPVVFWDVFQKIIILVALGLLIWYHAYYVKVNQLKHKKK